MIVPQSGAHAAHPSSQLAAQTSAPAPSSAQTKQAKQVADQAAAEPGTKRRRIAIIGSPSVGKSSLAVQYVDKQFVDTYYPTIESTFVKTIEVKGQKYNLEIVDTAGQDEYSVMNSKHFIGIHGYMLVYSVAQVPSFEMVQVVREKILSHLGSESVPIVIVGNKSDLRPDQRRVAIEEGQQLAEKFGCAWTEASASHNENVDKAFELLILEVDKLGSPAEESPKKTCSVM